MKKGFTIIEVLIVGAISTILFTVIANILFASTKAAKKSNLNSLIYDQSNWLMIELKRNLNFAKADSIICPVGVGRSMSFESRRDGVVTIINCIEGGSVASESAFGKDLVISGVGMSGCSHFVGCSLPVDGYPLPVINFDFSMVAGNSGSNKPEDYSKKDFKTSIVVRE